MDKNLNYDLHKYEDIKINDVFISQNYGEYKVIGFTKPNKIIIEFLNTGYKKETQLSYIKSGYIKDKRVPSHCGVGYLDNINTNEHQKEYNHWRMMINRCYNKKYHAYDLYGGAGVSVCERWHSFKNFVDDFKQIEGYSEYIISLGRERHLDKDIKQSNIPISERVYSLETCVLTEMKRNQKYRRYNSPTTCFIAIDPEGVKHYATNVKKWCEKTGHYQKYLDKCFNGEKESYKGWKFKKISQEEFDIYINNRIQHKQLEEV